MSLGKRIALNTITQLFGRFLGLVVSLWLARVIFNTLTVNSYAEYGTIFSYIQIFGTAGDLGLFLFLIKGLSQRLERPSVLLGNVFGFRIILTLALFLFSLLIALIVPASVYPLSTKVGIILGVFIAGLSLLFQALAAYFQQQLLSLRIVIPETIGRIVIVVVTIYVLSQGGGVLAIVGASLLGAVLTLILGFFFLFPLLKFRIEFNPALWKRFAPEVTSLAIVTLLFLLQAKIGSVLLSLIKGSQSIEMGLLSAAFKFYDLALVVPSIVSGNMFPVVSATHKKDEDFKKVIIASEKLSIALGTLSGFLLYAFAPWVILLLANADYLPAVTPLRWFALAIAVLFLSQHLTNLIIATGKASQIIRPLIYVLLLNIILNLLFIAKNPVIVPAVVVFITETLMLILKIKILPRDFRPLLDLRISLVFLLTLIFGFFLSKLSALYLTHFIALNLLFKLLVLSSLVVFISVGYFAILLAIKFIKIKELRLSGVSYEHF